MILQLIIATIIFQPSIYCSSAYREEASQLRRRHGGEQSRAIRPQQDRHDNHLPSRRREGGNSFVDGQAISFGNNSGGRFSDSSRGVNSSGGRLSDSARGHSNSGGGLSNSSRGNTGQLLPIRSSEFSDIQKDLQTVNQMLGSLQMPGMLGTPDIVNSVPQNTDQQRAVYAAEKAAAKGNFDNIRMPHGYIIMGDPKKYEIKGPNFHYTKDHRAEGPVQKTHQTYFESNPNTIVSGTRSEYIFSGDGMANEIDIGSIFHPQIYDSLNTLVNTHLSTLETGRMNNSKPKASGNFGRSDSAKPPPGYPIINGSRRINHGSGGGVSSWGQNDSANGGQSTAKPPPGYPIINGSRGNNHGSGGGVSSWGQNDSANGGQSRDISNRRWPLPEGSQGPPSVSGSVSISQKNFRGESNRRWPLPEGSQGPPSVSGSVSISQKNFRGKPAARR